MADVENGPGKNTGRTISNLQIVHSPLEFCEATCTVKFGSIVHILQDAIDADRKWVSDFCEEEISVSADLYDIIQAAQYLES